MTVLVFDIETIPDTETGRRLYNLDGLSDAEIAEAMFSMRRRETGGASDFLRHPLHRVVAISVVMTANDKLTVWSVGSADSTEKEIIQRFFEGIDRYTPVLVSWNGRGFDLPVLHYRALLHGVQAPRYWETGDDDQSFRWNNYLNRFHQRHTDLMDVLSGYEFRSTASLHEIATMLGLPGKLGMDGGRVWDEYRQGRIEAIRNYCETDVLNTYLIYLRYQLMRGMLAPKAHERECDRVREVLRDSGKPHHAEFLAAWRKA
jgi:hypothetical protein